MGLLMQAFREGKQAKYISPEDRLFEAQKWLMDAADRVSRSGVTAEVAANLSAFDGFEDLEKVEELTRLLGLEESKGGELLPVNFAEIFLPFYEAKRMYLSTPYGLREYWPASAEERSSQQAYKPVVEAPVVRLPEAIDDDEILDFIEDLGVDLSASEEVAEGPFEVSLKGKIEALAGCFTVQDGRRTKVVMSDIAILVEDDSTYIYVDGKMERGLSDINAYKLLTLINNCKKG